MHMLHSSGLSFLSCLFSFAFMAGQSITVLAEVRFFTFIGLACNTAQFPQELAISLLLSA